MGFGYRCKYIVESVRYINEKGGWDWLLGLRGKPHDEVRAELLNLLGVGKKVADCISLFSMDCDNVTPVDTHVY